MLFWSLFISTIIVIAVCVLAGWAITAVLERKSS